MQYVWQHRLWPYDEMRTVDGQPVQVIDPGRLNTDAGPDFFNAKVKIGGRMWVGNVEIHVRASDWHRHHHDGDEAYDSVILHVVERDDTMIRRSNGEVIPQMCMPCSPTLNADYRALVERADIDLPCAAELAEVAPVYLTDWISSLTFERLHAKSERIDAFCRQASGDLEEACYITLARCLGFGVNSDPFERLARSLPLRFVRKHSDSLLSVEALLFGQSGLLVPWLAEGARAEDSYVERLVTEYRFLAAKFSLRPLESASWKMGRMRPANFPHRRIAYLARLLHESPSGVHSRLIGAPDEEAARRIFDIELSGYWTEHFRFGGIPSSTPLKAMSAPSLNLLLINVAAPVMFNYGIGRGDDAMMSRAIEMLEMLPPEKNMIIEMFGRAGVKARNAACSQALIHLRRNYCEVRKCLYCRLGHRILSKCARRCNTTTK